MNLLTVHRVAANLGICSYNGSDPVCCCPSQNFEPVDARDGRRGCRRKVEIEDCPGSSMMLELDNARFLTYPPELSSQVFFIGISACRLNCLVSGSCIASTSLADGTGLCYLKVPIFESESLSWERRSVFSHNRYLEELEKYSKPGSVTEKKAYFEAEFRRKALLKQRASEGQDGGESPTDGNGDLRDFEEYGNCDGSPCSSDPLKCNTETEVQHYANSDVAHRNSGYDEDNAVSQHLESQKYEFHRVTSQDELGETHKSENENVSGNTEQIIGLTLIDHVVVVDMSSEVHGDSSLASQIPETDDDSISSTPIAKTTVVDHLVLADVSSEAHDDSSLACQIPDKDHDSISSAPFAMTTVSPKVKPAAEKKFTRSTLKTQVNVDSSQKKVLNGASKGLMKPRTSESKGLIATKTEKKSPRPASPSIGSRVKTVTSQNFPQNFNT